MNGKILMFFLSLSLRQKLLIFEIFLTATKTGEKFDINFSPRSIERKWKYILQIFYGGQTESDWVSNNSKSIFTHGLSDGFASEADLAFLLKGLVALGGRSW